MEEKDREEKREICLKTERKIDPNRVKATNEKIRERVRERERERQRREIERKRHKQRKRQRTNESI